VSGLEKEFPGEVRALNLNARDAEAQKVVQDAGFKTHGLIIRNAKDEIVWKQADHTVNMDDVHAAIRKLLATPEAQPGAPGHR
jgi:hypothetical protein